MDEDQLLAFEPDDGVCHPNLTYAQQTKVFCTIVEMLYQEAKEAYVELCEEQNVQYENENDVVGKPNIAGLPLPEMFAMFNYGRLCQANQTLATFLAHIGTPGFEHEQLFDMVKVPDDLSDLHD